MPSDSSDDKRTPSRRKLGELLVTAKLISPEQRNQALEAARIKHMRLGQYLVLQKAIKEIHLAKAISFQLKVELYNPKKHVVDPAVGELLPENFVFESKLCPVLQKNELLYVAMLDPTDMHAIDEIVFKTHLDVEPLICTREHLAELQKQVYGIGVAAPLADTMVLSDEIDLDAIQKPGAFASKQGLRHGLGNSGLGGTALGQGAAAGLLPADGPAQLSPDGSAAAHPPLPEAESLPVSALGSATINEDLPSITLHEEDADISVDVLPYVEAVEAVPGVEIVPDSSYEPEADTAKALANGEALLCVNDLPLARRVMAVAGQKYGREEVARAALMLGLAVLEEEPGLVAALNMQSRDPWR